MKSVDAWAHRSVGMRCQTCMYFVEKSRGFGRCRRHSPASNGYPVVTIMDFCGDHKIDETRVEEIK